ncbi:hypothetical protein [Tenacibaculum amylolyticum]|uniref:hypothetical protein n=1 Tax=Tenacibaculum amylolyticum TaxID=104269 RepID=UPI003893675A
MAKKTLYSFLILIGIFYTSCSKNEELVVPDNGTSGTGSSNNTLEEYLKANADYVHNINGFYIVGSAAAPGSPETTPGTTAKEIFDHSVRLFSSFLDQDNDGVVDEDRKQLNTYLANTVLFISGPLSFVDKISMSSQLTSKNLYGMSMQTDNWPYVKNYDGKGWTVSTLNSSTWRPNNFNALWEEVFHTITEAYSRSDNTLAFTPGAKFRQLMDADIAAGTYDISEQNAAENGNYDRVTAVNEYIHQIWAINFAGQDAALNSYQKEALQFMKDNKIPMTVNATYNQTIGTQIK